MAPTNLQHRAEQLASKGFLGGPIETFEAVGRLQLITLLRCGLYPDSRVLDLGCGSLRGGYWIVHFLQPDRYFGIEPNAPMLQVGREEILGAALVAQKRPRFATNDRFDPSEFGVQFDFFLARSIWTHASREQIRQMLSSFAVHGAANAVFLTSYLPTGRNRKAHRGAAWVGRSHESNARGVVHHDRAWIEEECGQRGFRVRELPADHSRQAWLLIAKGEGANPSETHLADLFDGNARDASGRPRSKRFLKRVFRRFFGR